ncbi:GyrI-like domain-containing protein [Neobacillus sp. LXY-1]|uniref:GyrI-like domain-containing protein n=1 Tax=Neobacillus sp. LXY-1 TaxID=3379133 RepID=UPI003EE1D96C
MNLKTINSVRTNNFKDERIMEKITGMWKESTKVLKNKDAVVYGLYYDYESNYKGDYSLSVATEGTGDEASIEIPSDNKYEMFIVDPTDEQGVYKTWKKIWESEEKGTLNRAYTYDFEKYYPNGTIEIYIAIK